MDLLPGHKLAGGFLNLSRPSHLVLEFADLVVEAHILHQHLLLKLHSLLDVLRYFQSLYLLVPLLLFLLQCCEVEHFLTKYLFVDFLVCVQILKHVHHVYGLRCELRALEIWFDWRHEICKRPFKLGGQLSDLDR